MPWPGKAAVIVSLIFANKGKTFQPVYLDHRPVEQITAYLFNRGDSEDPKVLASNSGKSFVGSYPLGMGFTFDDTDTKGVANPISEMHNLIEKDPKNQSRIFPYIGGVEVNDSPTHQHHRYIIDFFDMDEEQAQQWPDLYEVVKLRVKPDREKQKDKVGKGFWWRFLRHRPALYNTIRNFSRVLVAGQTSKYRTFTFLPNGMVYDQKLIVFAVESMAEFCVMHSRFHEEWALFFGSTMKDDPVYTPSDCFETFPFPVIEEHENALQCAADDYFNFRKELMVSSGLGLTKTYNRFHNPDERSPEIYRLRELHQKLDQAALDAYEWADLALSYVFEPEYEVEEGKSIPWRYRWPDELRDEVLGRLLGLNKERHQQENH